MVFPLEAYRTLETQLGKEIADKYIAAFELGFEQLEKRVDAGMTERKLQVRDELLREVATKEELQQVKAELRTEIQVVKADVERVNIKLNFLIVLVILILTVMNPAAAKIIEHWLKL